MDGVHVVNKGFHCLVHTAHGLVYSMLEGAVTALQSGEVTLKIIVNLGGLEVLIIGIHNGAHLVNLFLEGFAYEGSQVEVEGGDGLTTVHLVLDGFHGNAGEDGCGFYALCGTGLSVTCLETMLKNDVQGMLDAGEGLGGIVVFVVDVDVVAGNGLTHGVTEEAFVHIALGGFRSELHHHARRGVCVHVGVFTGDVVGLGLDDGLENLVGLGLAGKVALVAVADILLGNLLAGAVHEVALNYVLDFLNGHLFLGKQGDVVGNLGGKHNILTVFGDIHGLEDGGHYLLVVEFDATSIALEYTFYHIAFIFL